MIHPMNGNQERPGPHTRVLSLTLPENEWRHLLEAEPEPIAWLREQIRERLNDAGPTVVSRGTGDGPADACGHAF